MSEKERHVYIEKRVWRDRQRRKRGVEGGR